jgi:pimeloyl-ACP methyl ester carboxylesterase
MEPSWTVASTDGSRIAGYELGGDGDVLLVAHATGLCGAMYQMLADELTDRFRVVAFDFRGHGDSSGSPDLDYGWDRMAEDVAAVTAHIGAASLHGFGHSMGGAALLLAERNAPTTFTSMFLFEPIIFSSEFSTEGQNVMATAARRRRFEFDSRADVLSRYASRPPFSRVRAGFVAAYVENGFAEQPDGRVRLKCLPEVEAEIFSNGGRVELRAVGHITTPIAVAVGHDEPGSNPSRLGPPLVDVLDHGTLIRYEHIGHFGPLEDPWTVARDIVRHIDMPT